MSTIPASQLVNVAPSVLGAGGTGVDVVGLILTTNTRVPIGTVQSFPNAAAVATFFGAGTPEAIMAGGGTNEGTGYFGGYANSTKTPARLLMAQYPAAAVAAYLRGGNISSLTLAQLQAINGTFNLTVDGYPRNVGALNLSAATSFSSAAAAIQTALNANDPTEATVTASIGATFTGSQSGTNLTTTSVTGIISVGDTITGTGYAAGTKIVSQTSGPTGGAGVYVTNVSGTASAAASVASSNVLDVTVLGSGNVVAGEYVTGAGVTSAAILSQIGGAAGGVGTYLIAGSPQQVASEAMTITGVPVTVAYDSVSGAIIVTSGVTGSPSLIAFATGTTAASLKMTLATGAVTSQGAAAAVPAAFMNALIVVNPNWVNFATAFDPDGGAGNTVKQAFAAWKNTQNNRFGYVCWDGDITATNTLPATSSLGYLLAQAGDSGTCLIYDPSNASNIAAFILGAAAAIDYTQRNGRITFAYKTQPGLVATVTDPTVAANLGGNPQAANDRGNGYNFYGAYGTANPTFVNFQRSFVTGDFTWFDTYVNQVWLNSGFQVDLLTLLQTTGAVPYGSVGNALIEAALQSRIQQFLTFGGCGPGVLSALQIASVNGRAGAQIAGDLQSAGYYLQIGVAVPSVRSARTSPPMTFWYIDNGAVQALNLASVALI